MAIKFFDRIDIVDIFLYALEKADHVPRLKRQWITVYMRLDAPCNMLIGDIINYFKTSFGELLPTISHYCNDYICEHIPEDKTISHSFYLTDYIDHIRDINVCPQN